MIRSKANTPSIRFLHVSQAYLPHSQGLGKSIEERVCILNEPNSFVICLSAGDEKAESIFDKDNDLNIIRIKSKAYIRVSKLSKYYNSLVSGNQPLTIKARLAMAVVSITGFGVLFKEVFKQVNSDDDYTIITAYSLIAMAICGCVKTIRFRSKVRIIFSNHFAYSKSGSLLFDTLIRLALLQADAYSSVSENSKVKLIQSFKLDPTRSHVCYNWIDADTLPIYKPKKHRNSTRLLFVGRIVPEKGIDNLIKLAKYIDAKELHYEIVVVGDSDHPVKHDLISASKRLKSLTYQGKVEKPELWQCYMDADVFLMLVNAEEGFGKVLLEAFAYGLPVIGTNIGPMAEIMHYFQNEGLIENTKIASIKSALHRVNVKKTYGEREELIKQNRRIIRKVFSSNNVQVYRDMYKEVAQ